MYGKNSVYQWCIRMFSVDKSKENKSKQKLAQTLNSKIDILIFFEGSASICL